MRAGQAAAGHHILTNTSGLHAGLAVGLLALPSGAPGRRPGPEGRCGSRAPQSRGGPGHATPWAAVCTLRGARAGWAPRLWVCVCRPAWAV